MKILLLALFLSGCTSSISQTHIIDITDQDFTEANKWGRGRACALWVGPFGPFTSKAIPVAAMNGGISKVKSIETSVGSMIVFSWDCTFVYGPKTQAGINADQQ